MMLKNLVKLFLITCCLLLLTPAVFAEFTTVSNTIIRDISTVDAVTGHLTGRTQTITETGVDLDGYTYTKTTTLTFEIINGKAVLQNQHVMDTRTSGTETIVTESNTIFYNDGNGNLYAAYGTSTVTTTNSVVDSDNVLTYTRTVENEALSYKIVNGTAQVETSTVDAYSYEGTSADPATQTQVGYSHSVTNYTYKTIGGQVVADTAFTTTDNYTVDAYGSLIHSSKTQSKTTFEYAMYGGELKRLSSHTQSKTVMDQVDDQSRQLWTVSDTTTTYSYNWGGALIGQSATGTTSGYENDRDLGYIYYSTALTGAYDNMNYVVWNGIVRSASRDMSYGTPIVNPDDQPGFDLTLLTAPIMPWE